MFVVAAHSGREQPGADDVVRLRTHVHREHTVEHVGPRLLPQTGDLRGERGRGPRVEHVGVTGEPAGLVALVGGVAHRHVGRRVDRQPILGRQQRAIVVDLAVTVECVPDRDRHAEEALPADQPVAVEALDPVVVAVAHVGRVPCHLAAARHQRRPQLGRAAAVADVPLAAGHDLERAVALLVELDRVLDRACVAEHVARGLQLFDHEPLRLLDGLAGDRGVGVEPGTRDGVGRLGHDPPVAADDGTRGQVQFAPPDDVGQVAERADHGDAGALVGLRQRVPEDRHLDPVQRGAHGRAEQRSVALVVGMGDQRHARRQQLGACGVDHHVALPVGAMERHLVVGAGAVAIFHLGLGDRGLEVDVPHRGCVLGVGLTAGEIAQEGALADPAAASVDRAVEQRPVDAQPEPPEQALEDLLVDRHQLLAQLQEVRARHRRGVVILGWIAPERWLEPIDVGLRRIAAHTEVVLDPAFGRQPVVVPAHRVEHPLAAHALEASDGVGVGVAEHVAHVERAGHRGRRGVDREHAAAYRRTIESVEVIGGPLVGPARLDAVQRRPFGDVRHRSQRIRESPAPARVRYRGGTLSVRAPIRRCPSSCGRRRPSRTRRPPAGGRRRPSGGRAPGRRAGC